jgi:hypothetical protein
VYKHNIEVLLQNHGYRGKAIGITYFECVSVTLVIQHAKSMCLITFSVAYLAIPYFPHYLMNGMISGKTFFNVKFLYSFCLKHFSF